MQLSIGSCTLQHMNQVPNRLSCPMQTAAAQESSNLLLLVDIILLVVEGAFLIPLALAYMSWVRRACAKDRADLYSIFLRVPRPTVVAIAKAEVKLVGEDGDDDDDPAVCTATCGVATSLALPIWSPPNLRLFTRCLLQSNYVVPVTATAPGSVCPVGQSAMYSCFLTQATHSRCQMG